MSRFLLASLILTSICRASVAADEQADARAILEKAIKALGDEAAMRKVVAVHATLEAESYGLDIGFLSRVEVYQQGLDKSRLVMSTSLGNTVLSTVTAVVNGKEAWIKEDGTKTKTMIEAEKDGWIRRNRIETEIMSGAVAASFPDGTSVHWIRSLTPLRRAEYRLSSVGETVVAGRKVVGILVRYEKHDPVNLYFDKETNLLVKYERRFKDNGAAKEVHEEMVLSDYRIVQGFQQPFKMEIYRDGRKCA